MAENKNVRRAGGIAVVLVMTFFSCWVRAQAPGAQPENASPTESQNSDAPVMHRGIIPYEAPPTAPAPPPKPVITKTADSNTSPPPGPLSETEARVARRAWQYFVVSRQDTTGLFNSVFAYPRATMWDVASGLAGVVSAERLGLIGRDEFIIKMHQMLSSLARMPLYNRELPNREYDLRTLGMLDASSHSSSVGSGWSATDLGRLLIWLKIIAQWYPELDDSVRKLVDGWHFARMIKGDELQGTLRRAAKESLRQEGRLGYEQYAATGLSVWGFKLQIPFQYRDTQAFWLLGVSLLRDKRKPAFLTSEPFFLGRMEVGLIDAKFDQLTDAIFRVQVQRWEQTGTLTAISEDSVSQKPWFVYNSIFANGLPWQCVSVSGIAYPTLRTVSTKAAIAWWAIRDDPYSQKLFDAVSDVSDPASGYYAGLYESGARNVSRNLNTNAIILEAILYHHLGRRAFLQVPAITAASGPRK